jgi:hypothetical protein
VNSFTSVDAIVALAGLLSIVITLGWNIIDRSRSAFDDQMSQATRLLTGGTQNRSAGIAIIEGAEKRLQRWWRKTWRTAIVGLLCSQAVYLLERSGEQDRPDEVLNLRRLIELIIGFEGKSPDQADLINNVRDRVKQRNKDITANQRPDSELDPPAAEKSPDQTELINNIGQRAEQLSKDLEQLNKDLKTKKQPSQGLDRLAVQNMIKESTAISEWVGLGTHRAAGPPP